MVVAKSYQQTSCPVARTLEVIGERWSILLLRDLFLDGPRRFHDFLDSLTGVGAEYPVRPFENLGSPGRNRSSTLQRPPSEIGILPD